MQKTNFPPVKREINTSFDAPSRKKGFLSLSLCFCVVFVFFAFCCVNVFLDSERSKKSKKKATQTQKSKAPFHFFSFCHFFSLPFLSPPFQMTDKCQLPECPGRWGAMDRYCSGGCKLHYQCFLSTLVERAFLQQVVPLCCKKNHTFLDGVVRTELRHNKHLNTLFSPARMREPLWESYVVLMRQLTVQVEVALSFFLSFSFPLFCAVLLLSLFSLFLTHVIFLERLSR